jgi:hypothetical protein
MATWTGKETEATRNRLRNAKEQLQDAELQLNRGGKLWLAKRIQHTRSRIERHLRDLDELGEAVSR